MLKAAARQRPAAGQGELDLGLERTEPVRPAAGGDPLPITSSRMGHLVDALEHVYRVLGFEDAAGDDEVSSTTRYRAERAADSHAIATADLCPTTFAKPSKRSPAPA